jgi:alkylation response protein AidB-like acyl-CoA dehydrogenase
VLGDVNGGWGVSMTTLANERMLMSGTGSGGGGRLSPANKVDRMITLAREVGRTDDPSLRQALADGFIRAKILTFLGQRIAAAAKTRTEGPNPSLLKYYNAHLQKRLNDVALRIEGPRGMLYGDDAPDGGSWQQEFLTSVQLRIAGGTDEVQLNVIGERVLGLPGEPRVDKDLPFKDVPNNAVVR